MRRTLGLPTWLRASWRAPLIGLVIGLTYGIVEHTLDLEAMQAPKIFLVLDDLVVLCLPAVLGALAGIVFNYVRWQARVNRLLSAENAKLQREVLVQTLSSHILHEIRNPLHNLSAVLEGWQKRMPVEEAAILHRNLERLEAVVKHLSRWNLLDEAIDVRQAVPFAEWFAAFTQDKLRTQLHQTQVTVEQRLKPVIVQMHPLLLEQCIAILLNNAVQAVARRDGPRIIRVLAQPSPDRPGYVTVEIRNTGTLYPEAVLAKQGREPVESDQGLGLGLVLVRRTLEQIGGSFALANDRHEAVTTLWIPGTPA